MAERLDIIIFGVTGYTGKHTVPKLTKLLKDEGLSLTWGVASRSEEKIKSVMSELETKHNEDYSKIPVFVADTDDFDSLVKMTARAKLIINTVGPYRFYGEPVIKACLETGTHHVDVSGEPQYMESMQLKYHEEALNKGVYLLSSCGFDSIPADLGVIFLQKKFDGTVNSVESYLTGWVENNIQGPSINYGTWESAIYGLTHHGELRGIRSKLFPNRLPQLQPKLPLRRGIIAKSKLIDKYIVPFLGSDRSVVLRTQRYLYENKQQRPVQVQTYIGINSLLTLFLLYILGALFVIFCKFNFTRSLLLKYPEFFSRGFFSRGNISDEMQENTKFEMLFYGEGWTEKLSEPEEEYPNPPNKNITVKLSGTNPAYGITCIAHCLAAITVLTEKEKLPNTGGVYPPGAAFANTSIIEKLNKYGLKFEVVSKI